MSSIIVVGRPLGSPITWSQYSGGVILIQKMYRWLATDILANDLSLENSSVTLMISPPFSYDSVSVRPDNTIT